jgi:hypothetical protein
VKRIKMLRRALWAAVAVMWAEELAEAVTPLRGLNPRLDALLDSATVTLSVIGGVWLLQAHFARIHADIRRRDAEIDSLTRFAGAAARKAGIDGAGNPQQKPLRVAGRDGA